MRIVFRLSILIAIGVGLGLAARAADPVDFQRDVLPILQTHCVGCHSDDDAEGGLSIDSYKALMRGGDTGLALTAGATSSSRMLLMLAGKLDPVMPPEGEERPTEVEIETLTTWIEQGAVGPQGDVPLKRSLRTPKIETTDGVPLPITAIATSDDGRLRAVARYGTIEVSDSHGTVLATMTDSLGKVNSVRFSADGTRVLAATGVTGAYGAAVLFAADTGELIREMVGHRDVLYAAEFSPDQSLIATAGYDRKILLWDTETGRQRRQLSGHNGAVFDLAFSPDGGVLISGCADETVKVWHVETGSRLATLSQPEGAVYAVTVTPDGKRILAASADNRLRVWRLRSKTKPQVNPLLATRFVDESSLVDFAMTADEKTLVVLSESGNLKLLETSGWNPTTVLQPLGESGSELVIDPDGDRVWIATMDGRLVTRALPKTTSIGDAKRKQLESIYMDLGDPTQIDEPTHLPGEAVSVPRGVIVQGEISEPGQSDLYEWTARAGEVWAIDADATDKSRLDPIVSVLDGDDRPVLRTRLQAVLDSYFTFRGKDSRQINDFRLFNWRDMQLKQYLYAAGEVTRLWMYPRGPDSGYNVFPGEGNRWTYFGTTHTTHALGEPAYVVRALGSGEQPTANGLPVFDIFYENDDDPMRRVGKNSRLLFTAPVDGRYKVSVRDTRGDGDNGFGYRLAIRAAAPGFNPTAKVSNGKILRGSGREFIVRVDRIDGFDGPVTFDFIDLPEPLVSNTPLTIEPGQGFAVGTIWAPQTAEGWDGTVSPTLVATAEVAGRRVERHVGKVGDLELGDPPKAIPTLHPIDRDVADGEDWTLPLRRGETVPARIAVRRQEGFTNEISFGKENSGRNTTHGVYVDNIGLNGLLVRANESDRDFVITADATARPGRRSFFVTGAVDGNVTTYPITIEVLP